MADSSGVTGTESPTEGTVANLDVNAASSTATQGVNAASPTDRPVENWQREFQRKQAETANQLRAVMEYLVSRDQAPPAPKQGPVTDEELWAQAQQGDQAAFREWNARETQRQIAQRETIAKQNALVQGQLTALVNKYPMLNNAQHPLAQTMNQAYQLLLGHGYQPGPATLLEAAKTAIADRPDLVAEHYTQGIQAREQLRQDTTRRASSGTMGGSYRQEPRAAQNTPKVSPQAQDLAQRMGIKDPEGAMKRFRDRQAKGQSSFGSVAAFIPEEDI